MLSLPGGVGSVAFSVGLSGNGVRVLETGVIVPYNRIYTNEGFGYSNSTGVFTAPKVVSLFHYCSLYFIF
jgi:hypothetical protein